MSRAIDMTSYSGNHGELSAILKERRDHAILHDERTLYDAALSMLGVMPPEAYYHLSFTADRPGGKMTGIEDVQIQVRKTGTPGGG